MSFQLSLLEQSLERIRPHQTEFAIRFYETVFAKHPELKPYFAKADMAKQQQMLVSALILIVRSLEKPQLLSTTIRSLAERHRNYGTAINHFPYFGEALISTFSESLGAEWTPEMEQSWTEAYDLISQKMIDGLKQFVA